MAMPRRPYACLEVVESETTPEILVIRDLGPWDAAPTITNSIEAVIEWLKTHGLLPPGRRLFYYDSHGELTEAVIKDGRWDGYRFPDVVPFTGPRPTSPGGNHAA